MDLPGGVVLQFLQGIQTTVFLEGDGIGVGVSSRLVHDAVTDLESSAQSLEAQGHNLRVVREEETSQRVQETLLHQELNLLIISTGDSVGDGPGDFLTDLELALVHHVQKDGADVALQGSLNLRRGSSGDVRDSPGALLHHVALGGRFQNITDGAHGTEVEGGLGLFRGSGDDVSNGTEGGSDNGLVGGPHQFDKSGDKTSFDNSLDASILTVSNVRDSPAGITQNLLILEVEKTVQRLQAALDELELGGRLTTDQVRQGPGTVAEERLASTGLQVLNKSGHGSAAQHIVSGLARITSNVTEGPGGLFFVLPLLRVPGHGDEGRDGSRLEDDLGVSTGSRGDVGKGPGGFEFDVSVSAAQQFDETGDDVALNHFINGRLGGTRQHLPQRAGSLQADVLVLVVENHLDQVGEVGIGGDGVEVGIFRGGLLGSKVNVSTLEGKLLTFVLADLGTFLDTTVTRLLGIKTLLETPPPFVLARSSSSVHLCFVCCVLNRIRRRRNCFGKQETDYQVSRWGDEDRLGGGVLIMVFPQRGKKGNCGKKFSMRREKSIQTQQRKIVFLLQRSETFHRGLWRNIQTSPQFFENGN